MDFQSVAPDVVDSPNYSIPRLINIPDVDRNSVFKRWIHIDDHVFNSTETFTSNLFQSNILVNYFGDTAVHRAVYGFSQWRGTIEIKVVHNGSPSLFGLLTFGARWNPRTPERITIRGTSQGVQTSYVVWSPQVCQLPISGYVQPNVPGDLVLTLPYQFYLPTCPKEDNGFFAEVIGGNLIPIQAIDGSACSLTVSLFMRISDIQLTCVARDQSEATEGGITGKVKPFLNKAFGVLSKIPPLAPYTSSAQVVSELGLNLAQSMGFSDPPISDNSVVVGTAIGRNCGYNGRSNATKLTYDINQGTNVSSHGIGVGADGDDAFATIAMIPGFIDYPTWDPSQIIGTRICEQEVTPTQAIAVATKTYIATPASFITMPFVYWRGDVVFTVKVVCSNFHKGMLRFTFDPTLGEGNTVAGTDNLIIKLVEVNGPTEVIFKCPWSRGDNMMEMNQGAYYFQSGACGRFEIFVEQPLVSNTTVNTGDVKLAVFTHVENLELYSPRNITMQYISSMCQALILPPERVASLTFGERATSASQLCKKQTVVTQPDFSSTLDAETPFSHMNLTLVLPRFPATRTSALTNFYSLYNQGVSTSFLSFYSPAFYARGGSTIWTIFIPPTDYDNAIVPAAVLVDGHYEPSPRVSGVVRSKWDPLIACSVGELVPKLEVTEQTSSSHTNTAIASAWYFPATVIPNNSGSDSLGVYQVQIPRMYGSDFDYGQLLFNSMSTTDKVAADGVFCYCNNNFDVPPLAYGIGNETGSIILTCGGGDDFFLRQFMCAPQVVIV